jgi:hypothetical protein
MVELLVAKTADLLAERMAAQKVAMMAEKSVGMLAV